MALDLGNPVNYSNQMYPFEQNHQIQIQDQFYQDPNEHELLLQLEAELICFDSVPPSLFDVDDFIIDPPAPPPKLDQINVQTHADHDLVMPKSINCDEFNHPCIDFPPPLLLPTEENFPFEEDYCGQFNLVPSNKKQRVFVPCFDGFVPELVPNEGVAVDNNLSYYHDHHIYNNNVDLGSYSYNVGDYNGGSSNGKARAVSAQSKAARERRRRITEKTQELGKLVPGGNKMNTAEMLQAAFKYVKFLQAQLGVLQSLKTLHEVLNFVSV